MDDGREHLVFTPGMFTMQRNVWPALQECAFRGKLEQWSRILKDLDLFSRKRIVKEIWSTPKMFTILTKWRKRKIF